MFFYILEFQLNLIYRQKFLLDGVRWIQILQYVNISQKFALKYCTFWFCYSDCAWI
jgi:hypothetical protein